MWEIYSTSMDYASIFFKKVAYIQSKRLMNESCLKILNLLKLTRSISYRACIYDSIYKKIINFFNETSLRVGDYDSYKKIMIN